MDHTEQKLHDIKGGNKYRLNLGLRNIFSRTKRATTKKKGYFTTRALNTVNLSPAAMVQISHASENKIRF